jgi:chemotaxis protein MotB
LAQAEINAVESQRQIAALNEQVAALRTQLGELQELLDASRAEAEALARRLAAGAD